MVDFIVGQLIEIKQSGHSWFVPTSNINEMEKGMALQYGAIVLEVIEKTSKINLVYKLEENFKFQVIKDKFKILKVGDVLNSYLLNYIDEKDIRVIYHPKAKQKSNGVNCSKCSNFCPYVETNGTFICWSCRNGY